jgi:hemoglobin-like flavoprotein
MEKYAAAITDSLERVAQKCEDPTPFIYDRLFKKYPDMEALFILDKNDSAKGHMQFEALECVLDLIGSQTYAVTLIQSERINHDTIGVPIEVFLDFFPTIKETFEELLGEDWSAQHEEAWGELLSSLSDIILEKA